MSRQVTRVSPELRPSDVTRLVTSQAWPSVSILMNTTPADRMRPHDVRRLTRQLEEAEHLLGEHRMLRAGPLLTRLRAMAQEASARPTGRALALFANQALEHTVRLPLPVRSRTVVEATFATRDLVLALHRTPPHLLLLLHPMCAHLYRGYADTLTAIRGAGLPIEHDLAQPGALLRGDDRVEDHLDKVDRVLARVRSEHPSPLVLAGTTRDVTRFAERSRNLHRLAATVTGPDAEDPAALHLATRRGMAHYLLSRENEALNSVRRAQAERPETLATGVEACWRAARRLAPVMLVVDESYTFPARDTGDQLLPHEPDPARGGHAAGTLHHDLVDDLIEVVIDRGGWVAFSRPGALDQHDRIALVHQPPAAPHEGTRDV